MRQLQIWTRILPAICAVLCVAQPRSAHATGFILDECGNFESPGVLAGGFDEFLLQIASAQLIRLETGDGGGGCLGDTVISVYDSSGALRRKDDEGGVGHCSALVVWLSPGTYTIRVDGFLGGELGGYILNYISEACSVCGNGVVEIEACDDGNLIEGDGCDADCSRPPQLLTSCGAYVSSGFESNQFYEFPLTLASEDTVRLQIGDGENGCPGNMRLQVFDSLGALVASNNRGDCSRLVASLPPGQYTVKVFMLESAGRYVLEYFNGSCSICGNGAIEVEECDDGNLDGNDGCDALCQRENGVLETCGDYDRPGLAAYAHDELSLTLGATEAIRLVATDGQGGCTEPFFFVVYNSLGDWITSNPTSDAGICSSLSTSLPPGQYRIEIESNFHRAVGPYRLHYFTESCSTCGNGISEFEDCDGDDLGICTAGPCSASCTCPFLPNCGDLVVQAELGEQCDDGNHTDGDGCDANCRREPVRLESCGLYGSPGFNAGGYDRYTFTLESPQSVRLETSDGNGGCPGSTIVEVLDATGVVSYDTNAGFEYCSRLIAWLPAGKYDVRVRSASLFPSTGIGPYALHYFTDDCSSCGNGSIEVEGCDDGNLTDGDGCDASCQYEIPVLTTCGVYARRGFSAGDPDLFFLTLESAETVHLQTTNGDGRCLDHTAIALYESTGGWVASNSGEVVGHCSRLSALLPPGRYSVYVFFFETVDSYAMKYFTDTCSVCGNGIAELEDCDGGDLGDCIAGPCSDSCTCLVFPVCGDSIVQPELDEECDDGNTSDGDGCDAGCWRELPELTTCGSYPSPGFGSGAYEDFALRLETASDIRLEISDGHAGCPGLAIVDVYDSQYHLVTSNFAGGFGSCGRVVTSLAPGSYVVRVRPPMYEPSFGSYVLEYFNGSCSSCGNGIVEAERCDDGNSTDSDGCDAACTPRNVELAACGTYPLSHFGQGDVVWYQFELDTDELVSLRTVDGLGNCKDWTGLIVIGPQFNPAESADAQDAPSCARVLSTRPAGTNQVRVAASRAAESFALEYYTKSCSTCGNGIVEAEECDDSNTVDGDGCDSDCEARIRLDACGSYAAPGFSLQGANEFRLIQPTAGVVHLETTGNDGSCPGDTLIEIYDADGVFVYSDDQGGQGSCSAMTLDLAAGSYVVTVRGIDGIAIASYVLAYDSDSCSQCGDQVVGLGEDCDDGTLAFDSGDSCTTACNWTPCGQPVNYAATEPKASDALFTLQSAIGQRSCESRVCDVNDDGRIAAGDALAILRLAVGMEQEMKCAA